MVRFGYACINETLRKRVCCNRGCILKTISSQPDPYEFLVSKGRENLEAVKTILKWNVAHNIKFYRLTSALFPHIGNPRIKDIIGKEKWNEYISLSPFIVQLKEIREYVETHKIRLGVHPCQFCQLASPREHVVENSIIDLTWHANLLYLVSTIVNNILTKNSRDFTICIHGGGTWGDKKSAIDRLKKQITLLSPRIKMFLCLENCEKSWSAEELLPVCVELGIPLIFDFFHYHCFTRLHPDLHQISISDLLPRILSTWGVRRPKFHISEQAENKPIGAHSAYVVSIPDELLTLHHGFDIMVEAKQKEINVLFLQKKYQT
uniref:UV damage repair endonuclease n=1 Tax=viral metagenome TaxID=1070528 RepID=A0A6C0JVX5_9ZZZZ